MGGSSGPQLRLLLLVSASSHETQVPSCLGTHNLPYPSRTHGSLTGSTKSFMTKFRYGCALLPLRRRGGGNELVSARAVLVQEANSTLSSVVHDPVQAPPACDLSPLRGVRQVLSCRLLVQVTLHLGSHILVARQERIKGCTDDVVCGEAGEDGGEAARSLEQQAAHRHADEAGDGG